MLEKILYNEELPSRWAREPGSGGKVFIVGAGPGDPDLITVKGLRVLRKGDVIFYDDLVSKELLKEVKEGATAVSVGKKTGRHTVPQIEINRWMKERAEEGKIVIRLKGGDPFVFGRGAEEALYLIEHGIDIEVIPGVTSAISVPAVAGIPLTHRDYASSFSVVTGHRQKDSSEITVPETDTLVYLMCVSNLKRIVHQIQSKRRKKDWPCAVIENGTHPYQRVITGTLENIAWRAEKAKLRSPAVLVAGDVVRLRDRLLPGDTVSGKETEPWNFELKMAGYCECLS